MIDISYYKEFFNIRRKEKNLFLFGDQGFMNFLFFYLKQKGKLRLLNKDIQYIIPDYTLKNSKLRFQVPPSEYIDHPVIIHWAGNSKPSLFSKKYYDEPMKFFREKYYVDSGKSKTVAGLISILTMLKWEFNSMK